ncbi:MAG TPA: hypothetical protein DDZ22_03540 [Massilia sp.]|nr:hypothetical protein [Massilia sp.]
MEWFPILAFAFKFLVLGTGMFFAIKWHYDQGKKGRHTERRAVLRTAARIAVIFVVLVLVLVYGTWLLATKLGMDLNLP